MAAYTYACLEVNLSKGDVQNLGVPPETRESPNCLFLDGLWRRSSLASLKWNELLTNEKYF